MTLEIHALPSREGDAIWIRWGGGRQIMIDMGTEGVGDDIRARLQDLPEEQRGFELLVVTHVDRDHIGGVLTCLAEAEEPLPGLSFGDVWFNGWEHLHGAAISPPADRSTLEGMGAAQGERLTKWLRGQPWNEAFDRGPVVSDGPSFPTVELPEGLELTVIGPTQARLGEMIATWQEDVEEALEKGTLQPGDVSPGLESLGASTPPFLESRADLDELADSDSGNDPSKANGCTISLLLEWAGRKILLTGDAFGSDLVDALETLGSPFAADLFKAPHHGSKNNVSDALAASVESPYWLFTTDGTRHRHPDAVAIARVLRSSPIVPTLGFNVPSAFNEWWKKPEWIDLFGYDVEYGDPTDGLIVSFDPAPS